MGDLSLWDILLLKDEIDVWQWVLFSVVIPAAIILCIVAVIFLHEYASDIWWDIKYKIRKRKKKVKE